MRDLGRGLGVLLVLLCMASPALADNNASEQRIVLYQNPAPGDSSPRGLTDAAAGLPARTRCILDRLVASYGADLKDIRLAGDDIVVAPLRGRAMLFDDREPKSFAAMLDHPDLEDCFAFSYPAGALFPLPTGNQDPGRIRAEALLGALYGATRREVESNLSSVDFCGTRVSFNRNCGAAAALGRAGAKIKALLAADPALRPFALPVSGAYAWRKVLGTSRRSPHAYGIAIDLNPAQNPYWARPGQDGIDAARRAYPAGIIAAFEEQGFIWGGKWAHYDLMHFEYRPELLLGPACSYGRDP